MLRSHQRQERYMADINIIPFVDVALVLLVIFMVTAPMLYRGFDLTLPESKTDSTYKPEDPIVISIEKDSVIYFGEDRVGLDVFPARLREAKGHNPGGFGGLTCRSRDCVWNSDTGNGYSASQWDSSDWNGDARGPRHITLRATVIERSRHYYKVLVGYPLSLCCGGGVAKRDGAVRAYAHRRTSHLGNALIFSVVGHSVALVVVVGIAALASRS